ncbi:hypothetical protein B0H13DRAFT_2301595 [Mycena leptocephala]|nr:hypothetical protein B0H13DRAFT_2301595 [Mycena leptocephala]
MVLTRRAYKSIFRWLPNEVLSEALSYLSEADLVALCKTSRLANGLATPLLYCAVSFSTVTAIENFLSVLTKYADSEAPRSRYVREFSLLVLETKLSADLIDTITSFLPHFSNLDTLKLLCLEGDFPPILRHSTFPNLRSFSYILPVQVSASGASVSNFVNRHPYITTLDLYQAGASLDRLDPMHLPRLKRYTGSHTSLPFLICPDNTLQYICIFFFSSEDMEDLMATLGTIVSPRIHGLVSRSDVVREASILRCLVSGMPRITFLSFRKVVVKAGRISLEYAAEIVEHLGGMCNLSILEFRDFEPAGDNDPEVEVDQEMIDREIVELWGDACPPLFRVVLHGKQWEYQDTGWEIDKTIKELAF